jgi:hypothetical protein
MMYKSIDLTVEICYKSAMKTDLGALHDRVVRWGREGAGRDEEEGRLLLLVERNGVHEGLGMTNYEYVERFIGYDQRTTRERLRVARALEDLGGIRLALRDGEIKWTTARELTRVATRYTEGEWLAAAKGMTARQVEQLVGGHHVGDLPSDPPDERLRRQVLRVELSADSMATFREAVAKLRKQGLDEDGAYLEMARQVLNGPSDPGKSSYQIQLVVCNACDGAWQQSDGELIAVEPAVVEAACCDFNNVSTPRAKQSVTPALRRQVYLRDRGRCAVPGCVNRYFLDVHHIEHQADGGEHELTNLMLLCGHHHRAHHKGYLLIETTHVGHEFRHSDGSPYGSPRTVPEPISAQW